jgi:hypothetical protein
VADIAEKGASVFLPYVTKVALLHTDINCGSADAVWRTTTSISQMEKPFLDWMHSFEAYIQIPTGSGT